MNHNRTLAARWVANAEPYGILDEGMDPTSGSTDMANVSWAVPAIHPRAGDHRRADAGPLDRVPRRRRAARADRTVLLAATLVAQTALDLLLDPALDRARLDGVPRRGLTCRRPGRARRGASGTADAVACRVRAPRWLRPGTMRGAPRRAEIRTGGAPVEEAWRGEARASRASRPEEDNVAERPHHPGDVDFAARNGWDRAYEAFDDFDLPTYVGLPTFMKLPWVPDAAGPAGPQRGRRDRRRPVRRRRQPPPRRPLRPPRDPRGAVHERAPSTRSSWASSRSRSSTSWTPATPTSSRPGSSGRTRSSTARSTRWPSTGAIPIVLGGDHSITWPSATAVAEVRRPGSIGIVHFDAHADTANEDWGVLAGHGTPMRRLIESGAVKGRNFVQVGLRGYWPPVETFEWMREHELRWHLMREVEERGAEAVIDDAIAEALDGPDSIYISVDIDVIDPGMAPGHRHPGARRVPAARAAAGRAPGRRRRGDRGHGHRGGVARRTTTPRSRRWRPTGWPSRPSRRSPPSAWPATRSATSGRCRLTRRPRVRPRRPSPASTTWTSPRTRATCDLLLALAARAGGPVLELAVGSGRLTVPLAADGDDVTGVDLDPAMLARARAGRERRGPAVARRVRLVEGDARTDPAARRRQLPAGVHPAQLDLPHGLARRPGRRGRDARRPPCPGRPRHGRRLAARCGRPRPLRRAPGARVGPAGSGLGPDRHQDLLRPLRRATAPWWPDDDLRGGPRRGGAGALGPRRSPPARDTRRARRPSPRPPGSRSRRSPATTSWARWARVRSGS